MQRARELAALLDEYGLTSVSARWAGVSVRLRRDAPSRVVAPLPAATTATAGGEAVVGTKPEDRLATNLVPIEAPMVGTFYRAPSPGADPYVREGDPVKQGQIVCVIEAMKLMNEIESKQDGRIVKILVENAQPVEFNQPLFLLEPLR